MKALYLIFFFILTLPSLLSAKNLTAPTKEEKAIFAGGCFWCMESVFESLPGVVLVTSGYTGGTLKNPTYEQVSSHNSGHVEAIEIHFNPSQISYEELLNVFWRNVDPTDESGQFVDRGSPYTSRIFFLNEAQKALAIKSKIHLQSTNLFKKPIITQIVKATPFYPAEEYHQDYYKKNPIRYHFYRYRSGRDQFLSNIWGKDQTSNRNPISTNTTQPLSKEDLKKRLTPLQFHVTQEAGTEAPFDNLYWENKKEGIYVDIVSNEPLFSSRDKYDSGTGWPSFSKPLEKDNIIEKEDSSLFTTRTEVRSKKGNSHLGHVFTDGPAPTGLRYCINSASLRFIPKESLAKEGFEQYTHLFSTDSK